MGTAAERTSEGQTQEPESGPHEPPRHPQMCASLTVLQVIPEPVRLTVELSPLSLQTKPMGYAEDKQNQICQDARFPLPRNVSEKNIQKNKKKQCHFRACHTIC